jgi:hypothetical protein
MGMIYGSLRHTTSGRKKKTVRRTKKVIYSTVNSIPTYEHQRQTVHYPSALEVGTAVAAKIEPQKYTGTLVKGIGTMHKSNAIPIIDEEQMRDLARMRR